MKCIRTTQCIAYTSGLHNKQNMTEIKPFYSWVEDVTSEKDMLVHTCCASCEIKCFFSVVNM